MAGKGLGDDVLGIDAYDGVGGGYGCADGVVGGEGGEAAVDDGVADVGAHGVVYEEELVAVGADAEGSEGAVVSFATAGEYVGDFGVGGGDVAHVVDVVGAGDDDDLVDVLPLFTSRASLASCSAVAILYGLVLLPSPPA